MNGTKKVVYTLQCNGYAPELCKLTFPLIEGWAKKIGAIFHVITERKWPEAPPVYEKLQIFNLAQTEYKTADWHIFFDADTMIHPDFFDVTAALTKDTTCSNGSDFSPMRFKPDKYFLRDGRYHGKGNWCGIASDWCIDYFRPLDDISIEEAVSNIYPLQAELNSGIVTADHLIDDYTVSRNIARFGLKHVFIPELLQKFNRGECHLAHQYVYNHLLKRIWMLEVLKHWGVIKPEDEEKELRSIAESEGMTPEETDFIIEFPASPLPNGQFVNTDQWHLVRWAKIEEFSKAHAEGREIERIGGYNAVERGQVTGDSQQ